MWLRAVFGVEVALSVAVPPAEGSETDLPSLVSPAVDIWAFGVCVYTILVGSRPFQNAFQPRVVMAILAGDWDRDKLLSKGGPDALDLVGSCLEMDPSQRWAITDILGCAWLAEAVSQAADGDDATSRWKL